MPTTIEPWYCQTDGHRDDDGVDAAEPQGPSWSRNTREAKNDKMEKVIRDRARIKVGVNLNLINISCDLFWLKMNQKSWEPPSDDDEEQMMQPSLETLRRKRATPV